MQYYHADHLGSTRIMTDASGTKISDCTYGPFGEEIGCSPSNASNHYKFTGKERDSETGLDAMGSRYHSSNMGRLMTPDPLMLQKQKLFDPQQWNMYQYARNNPLRFIDPTGKYVCDGNKTQCGIVRAALDLMKAAASKLPEGSKERKQLDRAIKTYGEERTKNGVVVTFGHNEGGEAATYTVGKTTTITIDMEKVVKDYGAAPSPAAETTGAIAHEGAIAADQRKYGWDPQSRADTHRDERDGAIAQAGVHQGLNTRSIYGLWDPSWDPAKAGALRDAAIKREADSATDLDCRVNGCRD